MAVNYKNIRSVELENGCKLEIYSMNVEYFGHEKQDVVEITFLSPVGEEDEGYFTNNTEIFPASRMEDAMKAFEERLASGEPWMYSSLSKNSFGSNHLERKSN